ncbi:chemotaxis protein CheX [candidate division KSB1 bacterium]|nr:chemotaxis protein CheX [candidate division KSB1 bacterium]
MCLKELDANFINLFLESVETTFTKVLNSDMSRGHLSTWSNQLKDNDVAVTTGITGNQHIGVAVYSMKTQTVERIIKHLDSTYSGSSKLKLLFDGLGEVINIISGSAMTYFSKNEINIDITTPSIIFGNAFQMHLPNQTTLSADMLSEFGTIEINLAIKRYGKNSVTIAA